MLVQIAFIYNLSRRIPPQKGGVGGGVIPLVMIAQLCHIPQGARLPQHVNLPCPATPTSKSAQEQKYQRFAQKICSRDQDKDYYVAVQETKW